MAPRNDPNYPTTRTLLILHLAPENSTPRPEVSTSTINHQLSPFFNRCYHPYVF